MSIERTAIAGLKWTGAAKLVGQAASWAVTLIVVRLLAPEDYGLMAITVVVVSVASSIAELGLGASVVQAPTLNRQELAQIAGLAVVLNLAIGLLVVFLAPLAGVLFDDTRLTSVIQVSALQFIPAALCTVPQAIAYRDLRFKWLAWIDLIAGAVASLITLALALHGAGVWALVLGSLASGSIRAALLLRECVVWPSFRFADIRRHVRFGGAIAIGRLAWQLVNQSDVLIAGRFLTQEAVGLYSVSLHVATLPMQKLMGIVNQVAFPTVARLQADPDRLRELLLFALGLLHLVAVPLTWGISAVAPEFVALVFGTKWADAVYPLQILSLIIPFKMVSAIITTATVGVGAAILDLRNTLINAVVLPLAFFASVHWGVDGLASGWVVALVIVLALTLPRMCKVLGLEIREVARTGFAPLLAGAAMYGAIIGARALLAEIEIAYRLPVLILVGIVVYLACITLLKRRIWKDLGRVVAALRASA
jgi:O-antigen/teichoic acid export membrane protein